MKKYILLILVMFTLCACNKQKEIVPIVSTDVLKPLQHEFEYGGLYKLNEIFNNNDLKFLNDYLDVSILGDNTLNIKYTLNDTLYEEKYDYTVIDNEKPLIWLANSYNIYVGDDADLASRIICADNYDKKPNCYIEGEYDYQNPGAYALKYIAEDSNGNMESVDFTLYVKEKPINNSNNTPQNQTKTNIEDVILNYKNSATMIGIDVSKYQGDIDWQKVKEANIEFAIIRLGIGYDDTLKLDEKFKQNIEGAIANNVKVGIYFYSYAITEKEAISQAKYVIKNIKDYDVTFPIAFDWENFNNFNEYEISLVDLRNVANAFLDTIKEAGYTPLHYGSKNYLKAFWKPIKYDTWLAHYTLGNTDYDEEYVMWQLCDNGLVPGIDGVVDLDVYYK